MSVVIDFYQDKQPDDAGRSFRESLHMGDDFWEQCKRHVQWLFPLPEPSVMAPSSPVATPEDYEVFALDVGLRMRMLAALGRYILFLDGTAQWRTAVDHNHQRITRVIRCLCLSGLNDAAYDFFLWCKETVGKTVGKETLWYWEEALKRHPAWLQGGSNLQGPA